MEAFVRERGVTVCPAWVPPPVNEARCNRDDSGATWAARTYAVEHDRTHPLARIALAKIEVMLRNLAGRPAESFDKTILLNDARQWFYSPSSDFDRWCDYTGLLPESVRAFARKVEAGEAEARAMEPKKAKPKRTLDMTPDGVAKREYNKRWKAHRKAGLTDARKKRR